MLIGIQNVVVEPYVGPCATPDRQELKDKPTTNISPLEVVIYGRQGHPIRSIEPNGDETIHRSLLIGGKDAAVELVRATLGGSTVYLSDQEPYRDEVATVASFIVPPAKKIESKGFYAIPKGDAWVVDAPDLLITSIDNWNGLEKWGGESGFWIEERDTVVRVLARKELNAVIEADITPWPSISMEHQRRFVALVNGHYVADINFTDSRRISLSIKLTKGDNEIIMRATDENICPASVSDKRRLIVGFRGLTVMAH